MVDVRNCRFDSAALWHVLDAQRVERGLTWYGVTRELREVEAGLAARLAVPTADVSHRLLVTGLGHLIVFD